MFVKLCYLIPNRYGGWFGDGLDMTLMMMTDGGNAISADSRLLYINSTYILTSILKYSASDKQAFFILVPCPADEQPRIL